MGSELEAIFIGRVSVDFYPEVVGQPLSASSTFHASVGGTSANVAVAAARLGHRTAMVTRVGDDPIGRFVRVALERFGVDSQYVATHPTLPTPVVFAELDPPTEPSIWFYRRPSAPDEHVAVEDVDADVLRQVALFWIPGSVMAFEPSASTIASMLQVRDRRRHTVLDLDYRPMFWSSPVDAGNAVRPLLDQVTVVVGNREECEVVVGTSDPELAARRLLDHGIELAVVKMGADGVMAMGADGTSVVVPPTPVEVVCGLGAGDAFGGSLVHGLLTGATMHETLTRANAAGAIVASRLRCSDDMPTAAEIDVMLQTGVPPVRQPEESA